MNTPICDFVKKYNKQSYVRLHMPAHKGKDFLGVEKFDITEFVGADSLYDAKGIIKESQDNACSLFGCNTYYSTEGSSQVIKAMLCLVKKYAVKENKNPLILAGRNCHKSFIHGVELNGLNVQWLESEKDDNYLSCHISADKLQKQFESNLKELPCAVYITSPDYLGNMANVKAISKVCKSFGALLVVDNAHGSYLNFLDNNAHPIHFGADMCSDSAHKTLPVLTGGAYLQISKDAPKFFKENAVKTLEIFGSTSPSYLILQSLDYANKILEKEFGVKLNECVRFLDKIKSELSSYGYTLLGDEKLKMTILTKDFGYFGYEIEQILRERKIMVEAFDDDYVVMMFSPYQKKSEFLKVKKVLTSIKRKKRINERPPKQVGLQRAYEICDMKFKKKKTVKVEDSLGKVFGGCLLNCPPAVPLLVSGEIINEQAIKTLKYYHIENCEILDE